MKKFILSIGLLAASNSLCMEENKIYRTTNHYVYDVPPYGQIDIREIIIKTPTEELIENALQEDGYTSEFIKETKIPEKLAEKSLNREDLWRKVWRHMLDYHYRKEKNWQAAKSLTFWDRPNIVKVITKCPETMFEYPKTDGNLKKIPKRKGQW